jgi:hypothetical protein
MMQEQNYVQVQEAAVEEMIEEEEEGLSKRYSAQAQQARK